MDFGCLLPAIVFRGPHHLRQWNPVLAKCDCGCVIKWRVAALVLFCCGLKSFKNCLPFRGKAWNFYFSLCSLPSHFCFVIIEGFFSLLCYHLLYNTSMVSFLSSSLHSLLCSWSLCTSSSSTFPMSCLVRLFLPSALPFSLLVVWHFLLLLLIPILLMPLLSVIVMRGFEPWRKQRGKWRWRHLVLQRYRQLFQG